MNPCTAFVLSHESDPARSAQQLRSIESTARENLAEARLIVAALTPAASFSATAPR